MAAPAWTAPAKIEEVYEATGFKPTPAGAKTDRPLPRGDAPFQLYSFPTPNGQKAGIMCEELVEAGAPFKYDAHTINIMKGDQYTSGFIALNPNNKIPAAVDYELTPAVKLFESGSILLYLAEKYGKFLPKEPHLRAEVINWMNWQVGGQGPMTGQFGFFFNFAPADFPADIRAYGVARFGAEVQRLYGVLELHLSQPLEGTSGPRTYLVNNEYTIADMMLFGWLNGQKNNAKAFSFLSLDKYPNVWAWIDRLAARPGVQRGIKVAAAPPPPSS